MSIEAGAALAAKWIGVPIVAYFWWLVRKSKERLDNTYTKEDTDKLVDLKIKTVKDSVDVKFAALDKQLEDLFILVRTMAEDNKEARDRSDLKDDELRQELSDIKTSVAVVHSNINNLL